ncbi:MAG: hypothetical protein SGCHY_005120 [Lobulomycetales sp.]
MDDFEEFTIEEFYEMFVQHSIQGNLPVVSENGGPSLKALYKLCTKYLNFCRLGPKDACITYEEDDDEGYVLLSPRGLRLIENFIQMKRFGVAAVTIQTAFRRSIARTRIHMLVDAVLQRKLFVNVSSSDSSAGEDDEGGLSRDQSNESENGEAQFLKLLNYEESFELLQINCLRVPNLEKSSSGRTFQQYSPKVSAWMSAVLNLNIPEDTYLPHLLADGMIFCRLAVQMYPKISCHLLQKGPEFAVHRVVFFLELCKSLNIKSSLLFNINDLIIPSDTKDWENRKIKSALTLLRTICSFERQGRKKGWKGPTLKLAQLKGSNSEPRRKKGAKKNDLIPYEPSESFLTAASSTKQKDSNVVPQESKSTKPSITYPDMQKELPPVVIPSITAEEVSLPAVNALADLDSAPRDSFLNLYAPSNPPVVNVLADSDSAPRDSFLNLYAPSNPPVVNVLADSDSAPRDSFLNLYSPSKPPVVNALAASGNLPRDSFLNLYASSPRPESLALDAVQEQPRDSIYAFYNNQESGEAAEQEETEAPRASARKVSNAHSEVQYSDKRQESDASEGAYLGIDLNIFDKDPLVPGLTMSPVDFPSDYSMSIPGTAGEAETVEVDGVDDNKPRRDSESRSEKEYQKDTEYGKEEESQDDLHYRDDMEYEKDMEYHERAEYIQEREYEEEAQYAHAVQKQNDHVNGNVQYFKDMEYQPNNGYQKDITETREAAIHAFLKSEQDYLDGLDILTKFMQSIIRRRKVASKRASAMVNASTLDITQYDQENNDLQVALNVVEEIKGIHADMTKCISQDEFIGPAVLVFSDSILKPLISYACLVLSPTSAIADIVEEYRQHSNSPEYVELEEPVNQIHSYAKLIKQISDTSIQTNQYRGDGMILKMTNIKLDVIRKTVCNPV